MSSCWVSPPWHPEAQSHNRLSSRCELDRYTDTNADCDRVSRTTNCITFVSVLCTIAASTSQNKSVKSFLIITKHAGKIVFNDSHLEESQDPQFIENFTANLIHAISCEIYISLSHFLSASWYLLKINYTIYYKYSNN